MDKDELINEINKTKEHLANMEKNSILILINFVNPQFTF